MEKIKKAHKTFLSKITSKETAVKVINDAANGFFIVAGIQVVLGVALWQSNSVGRDMIIDGLLFGIFGGILRWKKSRVAAVILLLISSVSVFVTAFNLVGAGMGGANILLALIVFFAGIQAVRGAFSYHSLQ